MAHRSLLIVALGTACAVAAPAPGAETRAAAVDFNEQVRPVFVKHCLACHGGVKQAGGLSLVWRETALRPSDSGAAPITPGDSAGSYLIDRVADPDDDFRMPPAEHGRRLSEDEVAVLRRWIDEGARWAPPWSFTAPSAAEPPPASDSSWPESPIDRFVLARLRAEGLGPSPEADRRQWLRRVSLDLVGLPPTEQEADVFLADSAEGAHERVVDRLLASPHYGERWASVWLDLARYADSMGFEKDAQRTIWPYRDWVVDALNADLPYDRFLLKQYAGDLLPGATLADHIATGLHRNTKTNTEGGADDEEFRWAAVVDRVDTTGQAVLGLSIGCARCHDHPYDPIRQRDYYALAAYLNNTRDADLAEDWPRVPAPRDADRRDEVAAKLTELRAASESLHRLGVAARSATADWAPLGFDAAESTLQTRLAVRGPEVRAEGTVSDRSHFTLAAPAPGGRVTALLVEALPEDPERAAKLPETGFVLSRLRVFVERSAEGRSSDQQVALRKESEPAPDATAPMSEEVFLAEVFADEADGFFRPIDSIRDNAEGWGAYTRMRRGRWAVFVPDEPLDLADGDRLRLELKHGKVTDGQGPLVIRRLRVSTTTDPRWAALVDDPQRAATREREERLVADLKAIPSTSTLVLQELPEGRRRTTYVLQRGDWQAPTEAVAPATPAALPPAGESRLDLARWLGADENPLTARVMANRVWAALFGRGLVATLDDFGSTGARASHPELLDWLAVRLRDTHGWRLKPLLREVVLSATYRQDARAAADATRRAPENRLLARGPRNRLTAEMVRDQALVLAGKLNPQVGGPPVMPYQPDGIWQSVYTNKRWETDEGPNRFRRALYTYWKRTAAYPSLVAFDVPQRDQCTPQRPTTNTPLQALVTLNDPAFVELAEGLADRMLRRAGESPRERIAWAARLATGDDLAEESLAELVDLYEETAAEADDRFAMGVVANTILNLDATLTK
ncbi:PSD1 and planctomycete cytochrome C domain-containing protein [Botrimarina sp.]|uniref:PSD1 and planctomycete cytochrome C domain-containing protein n=1 Tax=Botrimarina sp. TaxID=2795802 RepID=UPI0032ED1CF0